MGKPQLSIRRDRGPRLFGGKWIRGFSITGRDPAGRRVKCWTMSRDSAERIRDKIRAGENIRPADFTL